MTRPTAPRNPSQPLGRAAWFFPHPETRTILASIRRYQDETILVVANLSRLVQCFELDLAPFAGMVPVELSGGTRFPDISDKPYFLNLGPFALYWFTLERQRTEAALSGEDVPLLRAAN